MDRFTVEPPGTGRHTPRNRDCELFLKEFEQAYADLRKDPADSAAVEAERSALDGTLMDGLEGEPA